MKDTEQVIAELRLEVTKKERELKEHKRLLDALFRLYEADKIARNFNGETFLTDEFHELMLDAARSAT